MYASIDSGQEKMRDISLAAGHFVTKEQTPNEKHFSLERVKNQMTFYSGTKENRKENTRDAFEK